VCGDPEIHVSLKPHGGTIAKGGNTMNFEVCWKKIIEYFDDEDWSLSEVDHDDRTAAAYIRGDHVVWRIFVWLGEDTKTLNLAWHYPNIVPANKFPLIFELISRLNYSIFIGKFVINQKSGALSFRINISVKYFPFSKRYFDNLLGWGNYSADEHYPKFMSLIYGGWTVDEVLEGKGVPGLQLVKSPEEVENSDEVPDVIEET
jgi:hypothetical protein